MRLALFFTVVKLLCVVGVLHLIEPPHQAYRYDRVGVSEEDLPHTCVVCVI